MLLVHRITSKGTSHFGHLCQYLGAVVTNDHKLVALRLYSNPLTPVSHKMKSEYPLCGSRRWPFYPLSALSAPGLVIILPSI